MPFLFLLFLHVGSASGGFAWFSVVLPRQEKQKWRCSFFCILKMLQGSARQVSSKQWKKNIDAKGLIVINEMTFLSGNRPLGWKYLSACVTAKQRSICRSRQSRAEVILPRECSYHEDVLEKRRVGFYFKHTQSEKSLINHADMTKRDTPSLVLNQTNIF